MWRVCVVDGWFTASPGLSQTDWTLAGWGCTPGVHEQSWHPRINQPSTHTLRRSDCHDQRTISSANNICLKLQINISCTTSTRVLCRRSPKKATSVACGGATLPHWRPMWGSSDQDGTRKGCPKPNWSHQPRQRTATPAPAPPERQRRPVEERGGSAATATGNRL